METSNIPRGTLRITLANVFQNVVMALFYIIVTKTNALSQREIGILSILTFIASAFSLLTLLDLHIALTKFASEKLLKNQQGEAAGIQKTITRTVLALSIAGFAVAALLSQLISQYLWKSPEYMFLIIMMLTSAFLSNIKALFRSTLQALCLFGKLAAITMIFIISSRVVAITLALLHMGVAGVIIGYITGSLIAIIAALKFLRGKLPKTSKNMPLRPLLHFSLPLFLSSLAPLVFNWADVIILTSLIGDYSLTGVYYIVVRSVAVLPILWTPITTTIFPVLSAHSGLENLEGVSKILRIASRYLVYIVFPGCLGLAVVAPTALTFFYGATYAEGATPLAVLSIAEIVSAIYLLFTTALIAVGKTGQILKIKIISTVSVFVMLATLVPPLEAVGAAFARLTTLIISLVLATYALQKEVKIQLDREALWKSALASTVAIPILLAVELFISIKLSTAQTLAIELLTMAGIYMFSLYILKALKHEDFEFIRQALPKALSKYVSTFESIMVR